MFLFHGDELLAKVKPDLLISNYCTKIGHTWPSGDYALPAALSNGDMTFGNWPYVFIFQCEDLVLRDPFLTWFRLGLLSSVDTKIYVLHPSVGKVFDFPYTINDLRRLCRNLKYTCLDSCDSWLGPTPRDRTVHYESVCLRYRLKGRGTTFYLHHSVPAITIIECFKYYFNATVYINGACVLRNLDHTDLISWDFTNTIELGGLCGGAKNGDKGKNKNKPNRVKEPKFEIKRGKKGMKAKPLKKKCAFCFGTHEEDLCKRALFFRLKYVRNGYHMLPARCKTCNPTGLFHTDGDVLYPCICVCSSEDRKDCDICAKGRGCHCAFWNCHGIECSGLGKRAYEGAWDGVEALVICSCDIKSDTCERPQCQYPARSELPTLFNGLMNILMKEGLNSQEFLNYTYTQAYFKLYDLMDRHFVEWLVKWDLRGLKATDSRAYVRPQRRKREQPLDILAPKTLPTAAEVEENEDKLRSHNSPEKQKTRPIIDLLKNERQPIKKSEPLKSHRAEPPVIEGLNNMFRYKVIEPVVREVTLEDAPIVVPADYECEAEFISGVAGSPVKEANFIAEIVKTRSDLEKLEGAVVSAPEDDESGDASDSEIVFVEPANVHPVTGRPFYNDADDGSPFLDPSVPLLSAALVVEPAVADVVVVVSQVPSGPLEGAVSEEAPVVFSPIEPTDIEAVVEVPVSASVNAEVNEEVIVPAAGTCCPTPSSSCIGEIEAVSCLHTMFDVLLQPVSDCCIKLKTKLDSDRVEYADTEGRCRDAGDTMEATVLDLFKPYNSKLKYGSIFDSEWEIPHLEEKKGKNLECNRKIFWGLILVLLPLFGVLYLVLSFLLGPIIMYYASYGYWLISFCLLLICLSASYRQRHRKIHQSFFLDLSKLYVGSDKDTRAECIKIGVSLYLKKFVPVRYVGRKFKTRHQLDWLFWKFRYFLTPFAGKMGELIIKEKHIALKNAVCLETLAQIAVVGIMKPLCSVETRLHSVERAVSRLTCVNHDKFKFLSTISDSEIAQHVASAIATNCWEHQAVIEPFRRALVKTPPILRSDTGILRTCLKSLGGLKD